MANNLYITRADEFRHKCDTDLRNGDWEQYLRDYEWEMYYYRLWARN